MIFLFQRIVRITAKDVPLDQTYNLTRHADEAHLIFIVWCIVIGMLSSALIMAVIIFVRRSYFLNILKKENRLRNYYETILAKFIADETGNLKPKPLSSKSTSLFSLGKLQYSFNRRIFKEQLLLLHKNLSGSDADELKKLYVDLEFKEDALRVLRHSFSWIKRVESITELSQLNIKEALPDIQKLVHHKNQMISVAALRSLVILEENPLSLLDNLKMHLSDWKKSHLIYMLSRLNSEDLPDFITWINHPNPEIRQFSLQLATHFSDLRYDEDGF